MVGTKAMVVHDITKPWVIFIYHYVYQEKTSSSWLEDMPSSS